MTLERQTLPDLANSFMIIKDTPRSTLFLCKPANPEPDPATSFMELFDSRPLFLCLIILGPSSGHPVTARPPRLDNRKPAYPTWCVPSQETTMKTLAHSFSLPLCLLPGPSASPRGPAWLRTTPFFAICETNKLSFQWQSSPDPLAHYS